MIVVSPHKCVCRPKTVGDYIRHSYLCSYRGTLSYNTLDDNFRELKYCMYKKKKTKTNDLENFFYESYFHKINGYVVIVDLNGDAVRLKLYLHCHEIQVIKRVFLAHGIHISGWSASLAVRPCRLLFNKCFLQFDCFFTKTIFSKKKLLNRNSTVKLQLITLNGVSRHNNPFRIIILEYIFPYHTRIIVFMKIEKSVCLSRCSCLYNI